MKIRLSPALTARARLTPLLAAAAERVNISDSVTTAFPKPGTYGPAAGLPVDRASGDVFMVAADYGIWKSSNHGKTFARADKKTIGGRCETG